MAFSTIGGDVMIKAHTHKFETRIKRKVQLRQYGATFFNPKPYGTVVGFDYLLARKCECGAIEAYDLERSIS